MEGLLVLGRTHVGSPSLGTEDLRSFGANHVESESAVRRLVRGANNALQRVLSILEMSGGRKNCQALTQSEVLNFVGWFPFCTHEEFY